MELTCAEVAEVCFYITGTQKQEVENKKLLQYKTCRIVTEISR